MLSTQQLASFIRDGYLVLPKLASANQIKILRELTDHHLGERQKPFELEADVHYPGAPKNVDAQGGDTIRRLRHAYERGGVYEEWAKHPSLVSAIRQILNIDDLYLNPNHHNCVMTKQPSYSSKTNWHRDTRYWNFSDKYLVNAWLALGDEKAENGGMLVLPGSHRWDVSTDALDDAQFLIDDHPSNRARLSLAQQIDLNAGDCLLFSAHCFHAAGKNKTDREKYSLVYTYHGEQTKPLPKTNSSTLPPIKIGKPT